MEIKQSQFMIRGMQQDLSISKFNPDFAYENRNIRITAREDSALLSITNERGNKKLSFTVERLLNKLTLEGDSKPGGTYKIIAEHPVFSKIEVTCGWGNVGQDPKYSTAVIPKGYTTADIDRLGTVPLGITQINPKYNIKYQYYSDKFNENDTIDSFKGTCIGYASLNNLIALFTHDNEGVDRIYRIRDLKTVTLMYEGNLNFDLDHLIDALPSYESESTQKIYWTDGKNQPRMIILTNDPEVEKWNESTYFDFSPEIEPFNFIDITKNDTGGEFAPGTIQYAFTYITDWHGIESNIANTSSLNYISYNDRGAKPDETCYNSFSIRMTGLDPRYKYVRLYSIHRTSLNTTPTVKIVGEYEIQKPEYLVNEPAAEYKSYHQLREDLLGQIRSIPAYQDATYAKVYPKLVNEFNELSEYISNVYHVNISSLNNGTFSISDILEFVWKSMSYYVEMVDTGLVGTNEDPTALLYKNNAEAIVSTMAAKDSTLFVGGYTIPSDIETIESINLYQEFREGTNMVSLEYVSGVEDTSIWRFTSQYKVASSVTIMVTLGDDTVRQATIPINYSNSENIRISNDTNIKSYYILKRSGQDYYSDETYVYFTDREVPPSSVVVEDTDGSYTWGYRDYVEIEDSQNISTYTYSPYLLKNGSYCKQFKRGQPYRFAIQGQYSNGRWGNPIIIKNLSDGYLVLKDEGEDDETIIYELDNICSKPFILDPVRAAEDSVLGTMGVDDQTYRYWDEDTQSYVFDKNFRPLSTDKYFKGAYTYFPSLIYKGDKSNFNPATYGNYSKYIYNTEGVAGLSQSYQEYRQYNYTEGKPTQSMWNGDLRRNAALGRFLSSSSLQPPLPIEGHEVTELEGLEYKSGYTALYLNKLTVNLSNKICRKLYNDGYRRVRLLYVEPTKANRKYPAQGILTNTIFYPGLRSTNSCWAYTDYLSRPRDIYRVMNEKSKFFKGWGKKSGYITSRSGDSLVEDTTVMHWLANPYSYPMLHNYTDDIADKNWAENDFLTWNIRPNYGHLMFTRFEQPYNDFTKAYVWGDSWEGAGELVNNFLNDKHSDGDMKYYPEVQAYKPRLVSPQTSKDLLVFDDSIVDFWSPDVEFQEADKNYLEHTVESIQIRGMSLVTSTTNSNYITRKDGSQLGVLGFSDASNYSPFHKIKTLEGKSLNTAYTGDKNEVIDVSSGVHRLILTEAGKWDIEDSNRDVILTSNIPWSPIALKDDTVDESRDYSDKAYSFKKYCMDTVMFQDLLTLSYDVNQPTLFIKNDPIKSINLYKTAYSGEDVTYNPGMDELLLRDAGATIKGNIPIAYKANTHLSFAFSPGKIINLKANTVNNPTQEDRNVRALPTMPELSAWAKFHNNQKIIGDTGKDLILLNIFWWPSKNSMRPDIYKNEAYSVNESLGRDWSAPWKVALQANRPVSGDITVEFRYRLGFWKSGKKSSKSARKTITIKKGTMNAIIKFWQDWSTLRDWSTINLEWWKIKSASGYSVTSDNMSAVNSSQVVTLLDKKTHISEESVAPSSGSDPYYLGSYGIYTTDMIDPLQGEILDHVYDNVAIQNHIFQRNLPYFLLVDLVRSDAFIYSDWNDASLYQQVWIPCGKPAILPLPESTETCLVEATEGDVYVGRYDCLRVASDAEKSQRLNDIVSFICESYTNPDGRSDVNRYITDTRALNFDNFNLMNQVYSQPNNYFTYNKDDIRTKEETGRFPNQFSWTLAKTPNSVVDNWANLVFSSTYNLEGEYGKLTKLITHNNLLYAFQDKAISNILFNTRVQVPVSDGYPIELANSNKVDGVRYLTTSSGAQNKWAVDSSRIGIYYIDNLNKSINLFSNDGIMNITSKLGFSKWGLNNLGYSSDTTSLTNGMSNYIISVDKINDDVYFHDKSDCLTLAERLRNFTSFFDYKDTPWMFNTLGKFLSTHSKDDTTSLYEQNSGEYNKFFDNPKVTSYVDYIVNPEMPRDKIFNNIEFRADAFNGDEYITYVPNRTLDHIHVRNEFQDTKDVELRQYHNMQKKFRTWRAFIPRDASHYTLNRIRNPWIKMKLSYTPKEEEDNKLVLHDMIVHYTV